MDLSKNTDVDFPELPEGLIWRVKRREEYGTREGYYLIIARENKTTLVRHELLDPAKVSRLLDAKIELSALREKHARANKRYRDAIFFRDQKRTLRDASWDSVCKLEAEVKALHRSRCYELINAEIILDAVPAALEELAEILENLRVEEEAWIAERVRIAASEAFVGDYPPLKLSEIEAGHGV